MDYETTATEVLKMGCPYDPLDLRATIWLEGARAGLLMMADASTKALNAEFRENRVRCRNEADPARQS